jgi:hypothetical protein|tara:strand:- start:61 stop:660 length:600 start_codon:yes stop_codon:yes gene_type:complete
MKPYIALNTPKFIDFLEYFSPLGKGGDGKPGIANITLAPFILSWKPMSEGSETHEGIHVIQQYECGVVGGLVAVPVALLLGAGWWSILVALVGFLPFIGWFYWVYVATWAFWALRAKRSDAEDPFDDMTNGQKGYYLIPFEREAYLYDQDGFSYFKVRKRFAWLRIAEAEAERKGAERSEQLYLTYKSGHALGNVVTKA